MIAFWSTSRAWISTGSSQLTWLVCKHVNLKHLTNRTWIFPQKRCPFFVLITSRLLVVVAAILCLSCAHFVWLSSHFPWKNGTLAARHGREALHVVCHWWPKDSWCCRISYWTCDAQGPRDCWLAMWCAVVVGWSKSETWQVWCRSTDVRVVFQKVPEIFLACF